MRQNILQIASVILLALTVVPIAAYAEGDATITLGTDPMPPECVANPGGIVTFFWEVEYQTTPDHVYYKLEDPTQTVTLEEEIYAGDSGVNITRQWTVSEGLEGGMYWVSVEYWSVEVGLEAMARVGFLVCNPASTDQETWGKIKGLFF